MDKREYPIDFCQFFDVLKCNERVTCAIQAYILISEITYLLRIITENSSVICIAVIHGVQHCVGDDLSGFFEQNAFFQRVVQQFLDELHVTVRQTAVLYKRQMRT